ERLFLQTAGSEPITTHLLPKIGLKIPGTVGLLIGADLISTDTYLPSRRNATNFTNERRTLLSNSSINVLGLSVDYDDILRLRQKNGLNMYAKLSWKATSRHKVNLTFTRFAGEDHGFERFRV